MPCSSCLRRQTWQGTGPQLGHRVDLELIEPERDITERPCAAEAAGQRLKAGVPLCRAWRRVGCSAGSSATRADAHPHPRPRTHRHAGGRGGQCHGIVLRYPQVCLTCTTSISSAEICQSAMIRPTPSLDEWCFDQEPATLSKIDEGVELLLLGAPSFSLSAIDLLMLGRHEPGRCPSSTSPADPRNISGGPISNFRPLAANSEDSHPSLVTDHPDALARARIRVGRDMVILSERLFSTSVGQESFRGRRRAGVRRERRRMGSAGEFRVGLIAVRQPRVPPRRFPGLHPAHRPRWRPTSPATPARPCPATMALLGQRIGE